MSRELRSAELKRTGKTWYKTVCYGWWVYGLWIQQSASSRQFYIPRSCIQVSADLSSNSSVVWPGPELANMRRCQDLVRKYILRSHSMIPNSYAIKPENLTSPLDQRNAKQYNFVKQERWINMIAVPLKGKIMFKVNKKSSKVVRNIKIFLQCCDCRFKLCIFFLSTAF